MWSTGYKFDAKNTATDYFNDVNGTRSQASFMKQKNAFIYNKTSTMQKCELSFGNRSFGIAFILPNEGVTLNQAITNLANGDWEALSGTALPESPYNCFGVDLSLPKFKIETDVVFEQYMSALGMGNVLSPTADYSNMADGIQFNYMEQKSIFEIDENGAEAASVTGGFELSANEHHPQMVTMTFDRPFLYVLYERSTGTILFAGCVNSFAN
ncbi:MAG: hypothetical protein HDS69_05555 [Bacteroidales bacterium]|nr:hypothetical protein [Bacteroidales bacterium]